MKPDKRADVGIGPYNLLRRTIRGATVAVAPHPTALRCQPERSGRQNRPPLQSFLLRQAQERFARIVLRMDQHMRQQPPQRPADLRAGKRERSDAGHTQEAGAALKSEARAPDGISGYWG